MLCRLKIMTIAIKRESERGNEPCVVTTHQLYSQQFFALIKKNIIFIIFIPRYMISWELRLHVRGRY